MLITDLHYPLAGLMVLAGGIGLIKLFDLLTSQSAKRLFEMPNAGQGSREKISCT